MQKEIPEVTRDKFGTGRILSKEEFAQRALSRPPPLAAADDIAAAQLPADLRIAIDTVFERGSDIVRDRAARMLTLASIASDLEPLRALLDSCKSATAQQVAAPFNSAWAALVIDAIEWPDFELPLLYIRGFPVVFDIADSGVYRQDSQPAAIAEQDFKANNTRMVSQLFDELNRAKGDPEQRERRTQCWIKTKAEIAAGLLNGPYSRAKTDKRHGRGKWRCMGRNAIIQKGKWRCIDNAKRSKHNKAARMRERITCGRADFPVTVSREFARRAHSSALARGAGIAKRANPRLAASRSNRKLRMRHGCQDLKAAYRHVPTSQPEYTCVAVINTDEDEVQICEVPGHNFGLLSAVCNFNRYPELAIVVTRRLLWVVCEHYYDDANTAEPAWARDTGQQCLAAICGEQFFGFGFDEEQTTGMLPSNDYLGVSSSLEHADDGFVLMDVSASRRKKLKELVQAVRSARELRSGLASSIFGKARFMLSPCYGGLGKACLPPLNLRARQKNARAITPELAESLDFIEFACDYLPPLSLSVMPNSDRPVVVFVDAEGKKRSGASPPSGHLGFVVYHPDFGKVHSYAPVPASLVQLLDDCRRRDVYIGQFELIGAITPFLSLPPEWFTGYPVELWIDNSGAMSSLVKDYSGKPDCARIVNMFHFTVAKLGLASLWTDFVNSESNPADVPSRAHELGSRRDEMLAPYGRFVPMTVPAFAAPDGSWLSVVEIARSVWG
jgi:hypothetical protein